MKITNRNMAIAVTIVFVAGALLHRVFPVPGLVMIACALLFYIICGLGRTLRTLRGFSHASATAKALVFVWFGMAIATGNAIWAIFRGGGTNAFFILVLLAADFLLHQNNVKYEK